MGTPWEARREIGYFVWFNRISRHDNKLSTYLISCIDTGKEEDILKIFPFLRGNAGWICFVFLCTLSVLCMTAQWPVGGHKSCRAAQVHPTKKDLGQWIMDDGSWRGRPAWENSSTINNQSSSEVPEQSKNGNQFLRESGIHSGGVKAVERSREELLLDQNELPLGLAEDTNLLETQSPKRLRSETPSQEIICFNLAGSGVKILHAWAESNESASGEWTWDVQHL